MDMMSSFRSFSGRMDRQTNVWTDGSWEGGMDNRDASGRQGVSVTQNGIHHSWMDAFNTTIAATVAAAATLRSQTSTLPAKNKGPLFPLFFFLNSVGLWATHV